MAHELKLPFSGARLQDARERAGLTRPQLARACEKAGRRISPQHIVRLERGESANPQPDTIKALLDGLSLATGKTVEIDTLLTPEAATV